AVMTAPLKSTSVQISTTVLPLFHFPLPSPLVSLPLLRSPLLPPAPPHLPCVLLTSSPLSCPLLSSPPLLCCPYNSSPLLPPHLPCILLTSSTLYMPLLSSPSLLCWPCNS